MNRLLICSSFLLLIVPFSFAQSPPPDCLRADTFSGIDMGAKINAAVAQIANATLKKGCILVPQGDFSIGTPVSSRYWNGTNYIYTEIKLKGAGRAATSLQFNNTISAPAIYLSQGALPVPDISRFEISDMTIQNQSTTQDTIQIDSIMDAPNLVHDVFIYGGARGLVVQGGANQDAFTNMSIFNTFNEAVYEDITTGGGHVNTNILVGAPSGVSTAAGFHVVSTANASSTGGVYLNQVQVFSSTTQQFANAFKFENTSGTRNSFFAFCNVCVADGTYGSDGFLFKNASAIQISDSWSVNHQASTSAAAWKFDNSANINMSNCEGYSTGQGDLAFVNSTSDATILGGTFNGTNTSIFMDTTNKPARIHILGVSLTAQTAQINDKATYLSATQDPLQTGPLRAFFGSINTLNDWVFQNIDSGAVTPKKYLRVSSGGGLELINDAHNAVIFSVDDQGGLTLGSITYSALASFFPASGTMIYCTDCQMTVPCAGSGSGAIARRINGVGWTCN